MSKSDVRNEAASTEEWLDNLDPAGLEFRDASHVRKIMEANERVAGAHAALRSAVAEARAVGDSWTVIGAALGISKQAAHERFHDTTEPVRTEDDAKRAVKRAAARVAPGKSGGWDITGAKPRLREHCLTKKGALARARTAVKSSGGGDIVVCGKDGKVQIVQVKVTRPNRA